MKMNFGTQVLALVVAGILIVMVIRLFSGDSTSTVMSDGRVVQSVVDSNYVPVTKSVYQPPSIKLFSKKRTPGKLPHTVKEKDVDRVISITPADTSKPVVHVIETKNGNVYIEKDSTVNSVNVTTFIPPVFFFRIGFGLGVSAGLKNNKLNIQPAASISFVDWYFKDFWIKNLQAPVVFVDPEGMGIGVQVPVWYEITLGAGYSWGWNAIRYYKCTFLFSL